jgi:hypothetical protein
MNNQNESEVGLSPTPVKEKAVEAEVLLSFPEALKFILLHEKIYKLEWKDESFYGVLDAGILKLHKPDGKFYQWILSEEDIAGTDYVVIK